MRFSLLQFKYCRLSILCIMLNLMLNAKQYSSSTTTRHNSTHDSNSETREKARDSIRSIHELAFVVITFLKSIISLSVCPDEICYQHHNEAMGENELIQRTQKLHHHGFRLGFHRYKSHYCNVVSFIEGLRYPSDSVNLNV